MPATLTAIILTFNESMHIERSVMSAQRVADHVLVIDSYSTDDTAVRAQRLGARVLQNAWTNHANQMNWALQNGGILSDWVLRLDADEFLDEQLISSLRENINSAGNDVGGGEVNRQIRFMGKRIRHGGMAPMWVTRLWRNGWASCESRWMDEHMVLSRGAIVRLPGFLIDENLNSLTWWIQKHNDYASREAIDLLGRQYNFIAAVETHSGLNRQARLKRWLKTKLYSRLPLGLRPWLYFLYRIVIRLGVLDGGRGLMFHTFQGLWYRLLIDAKVREVTRVVQLEACEPREAVRRVLGVELGRQKFPPPEQMES